MEVINYTLSTFRAQRLNHDYARRVCAGIDRLQAYLDIQGDLSGEDPIALIKEHIHTLYVGLCEERARVDRLVGVSEITLSYTNAVDYEWGVSGEVTRLWIESIREYDALCRSYSTAQWNNYYHAVESFSLQFNGVGKFIGIWAMLNRSLVNIADVEIPVAPMAELPAEPQILIQEPVALPLATAAV